MEEPFKDKQPHLYQLVIKPDNTYSISVDHKLVNEGSLLEDFQPPVNPPREIDDPSDKKPEDWDERERIPDPEAKKVCMDPHLSSQMRGSQRGMMDSKPTAYLLGWGLGVAKLHKFSEETVQ